jgi:hypothetical protein
MNGSEYLAVTQGRDPCSIQGIVLGFGAKRRLHPQCLSAKLVAANTLHYHGLVRISARAPATWFWATHAAGSRVQGCLREGDRCDSRSTAIVARSAGEHVRRAGGWRRLGGIEHRAR